MDTKIRVALVFCLVFSAVLFEEQVAANDIILISSDKEKRMGESIAEQVEKQYKGVDDPLVQKRFEEIGNRLAVVSDRQEFVYHFKVLKAKSNSDEYYNAFALPGGYVYMFDMMVEVLGTDDKIAAVTAHELAHISAYHTVKRLQASMGMNALMLLALATARDGNTMAEANEALAQLMMEYSREDEFEADKLSIKYVKKSGFNPEGVLESLTALKELRKKGPEFKYSSYKTHPYLSERISKARAEIKGYADFDSYINIPDKKGSF